MHALRKKIFVGAGHNTTYFGPGRREFDPEKPMLQFEEYLLETAKGTLSQLSRKEIDEGVIGSFMSGRFIHQANLSGFLPFMVPSLQGKPCTAVEGACGTGGRSIATAMRVVLSDLADSVFVTGFEMQNTMKSVYGADVLAGAAYYSKERKKGEPFFFPGLFSERAAAYFERYGKEQNNQAMAHWYEQAILNARRNPKAQEYHNQVEDLIALAMTPAQSDQFVPCLNLFHCSKISDGASSLMVLSEKGIDNLGIPLSEVVQIIGIGEVQENITLPPQDLTRLLTTEEAVARALSQAGIGMADIALLEIHDCFAITAILALEAIGLATQGKGADLILEGETRPTGKIPTNLSGGLIGFGHPTGATGVRQMVDLLHQLTFKASNQVHPRTPYGMMINMGGNDKTVTCYVVKAI